MLKRVLVRHPSVVLVLAVMLITALAVTGTAAADPAHAVELGNGTVEPMDSGGGSLGPTDP